MKRKNKISFNGNVQVYQPKRIELCGCGNKLGWNNKSGFCCHCWGILRMKKIKR